MVYFLAKSGRLWSLLPALTSLCGGRECYGILAMRPVGTKVGRVGRWVVEKEVGRYVGS